MSKPDTTLNQCCFGKRCTHICQRYLPLASQLLSHAIVFPAPYVSKTQLILSRRLNRTHLLLQNRQQCLENYGTLDGKREEPAQMAVVFAKEDEHRFVEHVGIAIRTLMCALALIMKYGRRQIKILIAMLYILFCIACLLLMVQNNLTQLHLRCHINLRQRLTLRDL